jgi:hypothetical protein
MVAVVVVFSFYFLVKRKEGKDWIYAIYFVTILVIGTVLYALGLSYKGDPDIIFSPLFIIAKSIGLSLKSSALDFGASSVSKLAQDNAIFALAILVHFVAANILTSLIAIKLFGKGIENSIRIFYNNLFCSKYIVIGASQQTEVFLQNLNYKKRKPTTVVLEAKHKDKKKDLLLKGFMVVVIGDDEESKLKRKANANIEKDITKETQKALKAAGFHCCRHKTQIISMSEDDELNLLVAKIVTDYIKGIVVPTKNKNGRMNELTSEQKEKLVVHKIYAHIMYNALNRTEHFAYAEYALGRVRFFNHYEIRARRFMLENPITSLIPKAWVNTEKARLYDVSDEGHHRSYRIGNFFIGYGNTNQHLLKKSICNYQLLGTDYNALIVDRNTKDRNAKDLEKQFRNLAPGLFNKTENGENVSGSELNPNSAYYQNPKEDYHIVFADLNVLSSDFYNKIITEINGVDGKSGYDFASIIISLGTDKFSIETALELRQKLYERKLLKGKIGEEEYDRVRIFVKILKNSVLTDDRLLNDEKDINNKIIVFGASDEILNEDYIMEENLDFIAKNIANDYGNIAGCETNIVTKWDTLTEFKRDSNRYAAMSIRTKLNLLGFELEKDADRTDDNIIKAYEAAYGTATSKKQRDEKASGKYVDFAERDATGEILDNARNNLARLEHQRWNTVHLVSGWTKLEIAEVTANSRQDEKAKQHACITTFEGLSKLRRLQANKALEEANKSGETLSMDRALSDADTICYDFDVMDKLFKILDNSQYYVTIKV